MRLLKNYLFIIALLFFVSCQAEKDNQSNTLADISDTRILQYAIPGKTLYENHCANCHQKDGSGLGKLMPPINSSDYMTEDVGMTIRIIKYGIKGEIVVNDIKYNGIMPANPELTNLEIAQIATYIYNVWGNDTGLIDANQVEKIITDRAGFD